MNNRIKDFLENATAGLRDDAALRLDIQAELRSHLEDKIAELHSEGMPADECEIKAVQAMGDMAEVAGEIHDANRSRMALRGRVRLVLRALAIPVAVLSALIAWSPSTWRIPGLLSDLTNASLPQNPPGPWTFLLPWAERYTEEERLILWGDPARESDAERQRAIWEAHPHDRVFLGNYITQLACRIGSESGPDTKDIREELASARREEPENARFDYLEATLLLKQSAEIESKTVPEDGDRPAPQQYTLNVKNRKMLDEAMGLLSRALQKPYMRQYGKEMLERRMKILGAPENFVGMVERISLAASVLLPDMGHIRQLARASFLYAELLINEGRTEEATGYLEAWETIAAHLNDSGFTLIEVLVTSGVIDQGAEYVSPIYRRIGMDARANRVEEYAASLTQPVKEWRSGVKGETPEALARKTEGEKILERHGGMLASLLMPAIGEWPEAEQYAPSRILEYTMITEALMMLMTAGLFIAMAICLVISLKWRFFSHGGKAIPILLIPDWRNTLQALLLGVVIPFAIFLGITRYVPISGHAYSFNFGLHKLIAEHGLLILAISVIPMVQVSRRVRRNCENIHMETRSFWSRFTLYPMALGAILMAAGWCFAPWAGHAIPGLRTPMPLPGKGMMTVVPATALAGISLLLWIAMSFIQGCLGNRKSALYYGTLFRSLIPVLAATVVVLSLTTGPSLRKAQSKCLVNDQLFCNTESPGFTVIENLLTEKLQSKISARFHSGNDRMISEE